MCVFEYFIYHFAWPLKTIYMYVNEIFKSVDILLRVSVMETAVCLW